jgi:hypothetical protein
MAPLQKRALYGLLFGILWSIAIVVVFILKGGAGNFDVDVQFRSIMYGLWIGGLIAYLILFETLLHKPGNVDERDKLVLTWAPAIQWRAIVFTLVVWVISLSEAYHKQGTVPIIFLFLIFASVLTVSVISQCLGILIGYWRMNLND